MLYTDALWKIIIWFTANKNLKPTHGFIKDCFHLILQTLYWVFSCVVLYGVSWRTLYSIFTYVFMLS